MADRSPLNLATLARQFPEPLAPHIVRALELLALANDADRRATEFEAQAAKLRADALTLRSTVNDALNYRPGIDPERAAPVFEPPHGATHLPPSRPDPMRPIAMPPIRANGKPHTSAKKPKRAHVVTFPRLASVRATKPGKRAAAKRGKR